MIYFRNSIIMCLTLAAGSTAFSPPPPWQLLRLGLRHHHICVNSSSDGGQDLDLASSLSILKGQGLNIASPSSKANPLFNSKGKGGESGMGPNKGKMPTILWSEGARDYFWESEGLRIENDQNFPLLLLKGILTGADLEEALKQCAVLEKTGAAMVEQHERTAKGNAKTIRRSRVTRLPAPKLKEGQGGKRQAVSCEPLRDMIVRELPKELREGGHDYEDGSVVFYSIGDFYSVHHDSWSKGDPPRQDHRAFTVLVYLRTPSGQGGTQFPMLTTGRGASTGVVVKPEPGDALAWPNFDKSGRWCGDSVHTALPVAKSLEVGDKQSPKIVVNMWWKAKQVS